MASISVAHGGAQGVTPVTSIRPPFFPEFDCPESSSAEMSGPVPTNSSSAIVFSFQLCSCSALVVAAERTPATSARNQSVRFIIPRVVNFGDASLSHGSVLPWAALWVTKPLASWRRQRAVMTSIAAWEQHSTAHYIFYRATSMKIT